MGDRIRIALAAGVLAVACRPTTSIGSTAGDTTSTSDETTNGDEEATGNESSTTTGATTQGGMEGSASEGTASTGLDDDGPDSNGPDSDGPHSGPGSDGPDTDGKDTDGAMCMPAQFDSQCIACAKVHCCPEFGACADDFECGCTLGCLQYPGFPGPCMCAPTQRGADLSGCLETECDFVCPPWAN